MTNLFKALSESLSRFILGWILPSAITVWLFVALVLPDARRIRFVNNLSPQLHGDLQILGAFSLTVLSLATIFAYAARPIYQLLEGYSLPRRLKNRMRMRQLRKLHRLIRMQSSPNLSDADAGNLAEARDQYPNDPRNVMPTQLGNALYAMEGYGSDRFGLDSQVLWYELESVTSEYLRRCTEETRAQVDFFVSAAAHLALLGTVALAVAFGHGIQRTSLVASVGSLALIPIAYRAAVASISDWRYSIQAVVNTSRHELAAAMGLVIPPTFEKEIEMWKDLSGYVGYGDKNQLPALNPWRRSEGQGL